MPDKSPNNGEKSSHQDRPRLTKSFRKDELSRLEIEFARLQYHIKRTGMKVAVLFEGRDASGKGGMIRTITRRLNPRVVNVVALDKPSDVERTQWYFQRYAAHLPAAGHMVLFDRSWYNRAGVEHVMGFCTEADYEEFLRAVPEFERMLLNSGIHLIKYWLEVSPDVQDRRFHDRIKDPVKRWKLSSMDHEARARWTDYSRARDKMFEATDLEHSPWYVIDGDHKWRARLNCMRHILSLLPYDKKLPAPSRKLPPLEADGGYHRPKDFKSRLIPDWYGRPDAGKGHS